MQALVYLTSRSIVNGLKRALTSWKRLISLLVILAYWSQFLFRGFYSPSSRIPTRGRLPIQFPETSVIDSIVFGVFVVLTTLLLGSITNFNRTLRPADIDVLFPTPVSPKVVMVFRVIRDYLATLILPLFIGAVSWRSARLDMFASAPHSPLAGYLMKATVFAWILLAMAFTVTGYAVSLFVNRSDLASDRNHKRLNWVVGLTVLGLSLYAALALRSDFSAEKAMELAHSPVFRIPFFFATFATWFATGTLTSVYWTVAGGAALIGIAALALSVALSQASWMYDQAAVKGFESSASMQFRRSGDMMGLIASKARAGKLKAGRQTFVSRLRWQRGGGIFWRDLIIQSRTGRSTMILFTLMTVFYSLMPLLLFKNIGARHAGTLVVEGPMFLAFQSLGMFMGVMGQTQVGFMETLRRIDLLKPLPFTPARFVTLELLAKTMVPVAISLVVSLIAFAFEPTLWAYLIASVIYNFTLAFLLASAMFTVLLLFPEIDDPTQRGFRGLMQLLGIALLAVPGVISMVAFFVYFKMPILGAVVAGSLNVGVTLLVSIASGALYRDFNPSE